MAANASSNNFSDLLDALQKKLGTGQQLAQNTPPINSSVMNMAVPAAQDSPVSMPPVVAPNQTPKPVVQTTPTSSADQVTPAQDLSPNPAALLGNMGGLSPISPEEKKAQKALLENAQKSNDALSASADQQSMIVKLKQYLADHPQQDLTPMIQGFYNLAGTDGSKQLASAKPDSPDDLLKNLQGAIKDQSGEQDKLSDNEANLLKMRLQFANQKGLAANQFKEDKMWGDTLTKAAKGFDPASATSRNGLGSPYKALQSIQSVQGVADSTNDRNSLTKEQVNELYTGLAGVVSRGSGNVSEGKIAALVPGNAAKDLAGVEQWLLSKPEPAQQKAFVDNAMALLAREKQIAQSQILEGQVNNHQTYGARMAMAPEKYQKAYQQVMMHYGVPANGQMPITAQPAAPVAAGGLDPAAIAAEMKRRGLSQ